MYSDKQLKQWAVAQRQLHKAGRLPTLRQKKCETVDGWYWFEDLETRMVEKARQMFERSIQRGSLPKANNDDPQERRDHVWLHGQRAAKDGRGSREWYPILDTIATEYGFDDAFDLVDVKSQVIERATGIFERAKVKGYLPSQTSKLPQESIDGQWLSRYRQARNLFHTGRETTRKTVWYKELDEIADKYGFSNALAVLTLEQEAINKAHEIFQRAKARKSLPSQTKFDPVEHADGGWIQGRKRAKFAAKNDLKAGVWYPVLDNIANEYGFPDAFNYQDKNVQLLEMARQVFSRASERGRLPKAHSKDPQEIKDATWFNHQKKKPLNIEIENIAIDCGFVKAFEKMDVKADAIAKAHEIFQRAKDAGRLPRNHCGSGQEAKDAVWLTFRKQAKKQRDDRSWAWYPELNDIAREYGFPNAFDLRDSKALTIQKAHDVFNRAKSAGCLPRKTIEKSDAGWIQKQRKAKAIGGSKHGEWYPEIEDIASSYGFIGVFGNKVDSIFIRAKKVFSWAAEHGHLPKSHSKEKPERTYGAWFKHQLGVKEGRRDGTWYPRIEEIAAEYGFSCAFNNAT